jgi:hypothetical protein
LTGCTPRRTWAASRSLHRKQSPECYCETKLRV